MSTQTPNKIRGVVWDLDGTLIDSDLYLVANYLHMYEKYRPGYYPHLRKIISFSGPSVTQTLTEQFPDVPMEEKMTEFVRFSLTNEPKYLTLYKGERETLEGIKNLGLPQCVFTNKKRVSALNCLKGIHIDQYFQGVVALDDVSKPKPDPEGLRKCAEIMKLPVESLLVIGDSKGDVLSGKNAGCFTGLVTWSLKGVPDIERTFSFDTMEEILDCLKNNR